MDNFVLNIPLGLLLWILGILFAVIGTVFSIVYTNLNNKVEDVDDELGDYRKCTDVRIETLLLELTVVKEKIISKRELMEAIDEAVDTAFTKWENKLFRDGRLSPIKPSKKGE